MAFSTLPYRSHVPWVCGSYSFLAACWTWLKKHGLCGLSVRYSVRPKHIPNKSRSFSILKCPPKLEILCMKLINSVTLWHKEQQQYVWAYLSSSGVWESQGGICSGAQPRFRQSPQRQTSFWQEMVNVAQVYCKGEIKKKKMFALLNRRAFQK